MNFTIIDLTLLAISAIAISIFLYIHRKKLTREGLMLLYKTNVGVKRIQKFGEKHEKLLNALSYVSISLGFILMGAMIYFFGKITWTYIFQKEVVQMIKVPPIMPLLPYLPQVFKLNLPPFYFTYWIVIIAIVAICHEFSHGIFAVNKKVDVKSTGFGFFPFFLPIFLAAFVELDEKKMAKKKISSQMAVLSAGTFANIILTIGFLIIMILFFMMSFTQSGVVFDSYTYSAIGLANITSIDGFAVTNVNYEDIANFISESDRIEIDINDDKYILTKELFQKQKENDQYLLAYSGPAARAGIENVIVKINGVSVEKRDSLESELLKYSPEDKIIITTLSEDSYKDYEVVLEENPENESVPYLGVGFLNRQGSGIIGKIVGLFDSFKNPNSYYKPNFAFAEFIYNLLWWLVIINFSVALVNMLPVGIFDGGRFFYLTVLAITKSEKKAKKAFSILTYLFLALLAVIMIFWAKSFF